MCYSGEATLDDLYNLLGDWASPAVGCHDIDDAGTDDAG
jgi:hypothetical protein